MAETTELHEKLTKRANDVRDQMHAIVEKAESEDRDLTEVENKVLAEHRAKRESLDAQAAVAEESIHREANHAKRVAEIVHSIPQAEHDLHRTKGEENIYNPERTSVRRDEGGYGFLTDHLIIRNPANPEYEQARERLTKHREQTKAQGRHFEMQTANAEARAATGDLDGLVPPVYLIDESDTALRSMAPTASAMNLRALPNTGMTIHIPLVSTATTAAGDEEGTTLQTTDPAATDLEIPVHTIAGYFELTHQAIQRGVMVDDLLTRDLQEAVETRINLDVLYGGESGDTHTVKGLLGSASTLASGNKLSVTQSNPSHKEVYPQIVNLATKVAETRFRRATHLVMHPARLGNFAKGLDTQGRPVYQALSNTAMNVMAHGDQAGAVGATGVSIAGIPVISDAAIKTNLGTNTNQDQVLAFYAPEMLLFRSPPMMLSGMPNLSSWKHMITMGRFVAFAPKRNVSAASLGGTLLSVR